MLTPDKFIVQVAHALNDAPLSDVVFNLHSSVRIFQRLLDTTCARTPYPSDTSSLHHRLHGRATLKPKPLP